MTSEEHAAALKLIQDHWHAPEDSPEFVRLRAAIVAVDEHEKGLWSAVAERFRTLEAKLAATRSELADVRAGKDAAYEERDRVVALACALARDAGYATGRRPHQGEDWGPRWREVAVIELPGNSQLSWHYPVERAHLFASLQEHPRPWDGHDTPTKYARIEEFVRRHELGGDDAMMTDARARRELRSAPDLIREFASGAEAAHDGAREVLRALKNRVDANLFDELERYARELGTVAADAELLAAELEFEAASSQRVAAGDK